MWAHESHSGWHEGEGGGPELGRPLGRPCSLYLLPHTLLTPSPAGEGAGAPLGKRVPTCAARGPFPIPAWEWVDWGPGICDAGRFFPS